MNITDADVEAGQAIYTRRTLQIYDLVVLGISNPLLWKCPTRRLQQHYNEHLSANHLDVGVGTGYFLDRSRFPSQTPRIGLMDLNADTLEFASQRIARYRPETYRCNLLDPVALQIPGFDSIGVNYLLHCIPGTIATKAVVFDHLKPLMNPGAVLFGSTILQGDLPRNWLAQRLMNIYNRKGVFSNEKDTLADLQQALDQRFNDTFIEVRGCVALFSARV